MGFLIRLLGNSLAILLVAHLLPGVEVSGILAVVAAALVLGFVNAVVRPILVFLTIPFTILTLGLFLLLLNGFCLWATAQLVKGFEVDGFFPAVLGALLVSLVSWILTLLLSDRGKFVLITRKSSYGRRKTD